MKLARSLRASVLAAGLLASCGDDGPNDQRSAVESAAAPVAATVRWNGETFVPSTVELSPGSAIDLINDSAVTARWVSEELDTGSQPAGGSIRLAFDEAGTTELHPFDATDPVLTVVVLAG